jgi:PilZ domain
MHSAAPETGLVVAQPTGLRAEPGSRVVVSFLDTERDGVEGALRHLADDHLECWSRSTFQTLSSPRAVLATLTANGELWHATGIAMRGSEQGAIRVSFDHPLARKDKRSHPRFELAWPITIVFDQHVVTGTTLDVSMGGVRLAVGDVSDVPMKVGKWCALSMNFLRRGIASSFLGIAVVRAVEPGQWGLQFCNLPARMSEALQDALREHQRTQVGGRQ